MSNEPTSTCLMKPSYIAHKKIFQTICSYGLAVVFLHLVFNLWYASTSQWFSVLVDVCIAGLLVAFLAVSRFCKDYAKLIWAFILIAQLSTIPLWFTMGGLNSPMITCNITILLLSLLLDNNKRSFSIGVLVITTTLAAIALEYMFPEKIIPYQSFWTQSVDTVVLFICMIIIIVLVYCQMVAHYEVEKSLVIEKTKELKALQERETAQRELLKELEALQTKNFLGEEKKESLQQFLSLLMNTTESQSGFVLSIKENLADEKENQLEVLAVRDTQQVLVEETFLKTSHWSVNGQLLSLQQLVDLVVTEGRRMTFPIAQNENTTAMVCFPVLYNEELIGIIGLTKFKGFSPITLEHTLPFLPTCSNMLRNINIQRQQRKYEAALKEAKEIAEQAVATKNQLFANITHELRTPLSLVVGPISALLKKQDQNKLSEDAKASLEMVLRNSKNMLQHINDIMDLTKLNSSTLKLNLSDNHLYTFIKSIYQAFEIQKTYSSIDYVLEYEANKELIIQFDPKKMERIINNLLSNAFKYTPDAGKITLVVREEKDNVYIEVKDTGIGIAKEELPYIFERFYQGKNAQHIAAKGTGIGLALAQELALLQGFSLEVESEVNKGARLFFRMPKKEASVAGVTNNQPQIEDTISAQLSERDNSKPSILVVEDNHDMAAFIKLVLQSDYNIDIAQNGAIAWKILQGQQKYDLVITDLMMPEMDGFELLRCIKSSSFETKLPVIVLTARVDTESKLEALTIGIDEYLTKPFSVEELTIHVRNLIQNAQVRLQTIQEEKEGNNTSKKTKEKAVNLAKEAKMTPAQREKIEEAKRVVLEQLDNTQFSVDDLAKALITSKRQLYRFMQLHTGLTPLKFINEIRLQEARRMLEQGLCSTVKEVSYSIGFMSTRHFSKTYSNRFGKKPSEYLR